MSGRPLTAFGTHRNGRTYVHCRPGHRPNRYPFARIVMWNVMGRELARDEVVHHINGDCTDDRIENLQIVTPREHMAIHRRELAVANTKPLIAAECSTCGAEFSLRQVDVNRGGGKYCSRACQYEGMKVAKCRRYGHPRTPENTYTYTDGRTASTAPAPTHKDAAAALERPAA